MSPPSGRTKAPSPLVRELSRELARHADAKYRAGVQGFFREPVELHGVRTPDVRRISRAFWSRLKHLPKSEILALCDELAAVGTFEERGIAFGWAERLADRFEPRDFARLERWLVRHVSNWAACDTLSCGPLGRFLLRFPEFLPRLGRWARSRNRWQRRAAAVALIIPNRQGRYLDEAFEIADILHEDSDDMVQKGYGWMLKEIANRERGLVFDYVMRNRHRMPRTALRYAIEKMPPALKRRAMARPR
ncbi:MAG: DNA alkylation repair protein [bacterium]